MPLLLIWHSSMPCGALSPHVKQEAAAISVCSFVKLSIRIFQKLRPNQFLDNGLQIFLIKIHELTNLRKGWGVTLIYEFNNLIRQLGCNIQVNPLYLK